MNKEKRNLNASVIITMIFGAACFRFIDIAPNFSPIAGMSLFGAAYLSKKYLALIIPFLALWISNLVLDNVFYAQYYEGFQWFSQPYVFIGFIAIVLMGFGLLKKVSFARVLGASLSASVIFFLISNFGSWLGDPIYTKDFTGLLTAYAAGIPFIFGSGAEPYFFLNGVFGDLFFTGFLFGTFELVKLNFPKLAFAK